MRRRQRTHPGAHLRAAGEDRRYTPWSLLFDTGAERSDLLAITLTGRGVERRSSASDEQLYAASGKMTSRIVKGATLSVGDFAIRTDVALIPGTLDPDCPRDGVVSMDVLRACVLVLGRRSDGVAAAACGGDGAELASRLASAIRACTGAPAGGEHGIDRGVSDVGVRTLPLEAHVPLVVLEARHVRHGEERAADAVVQHEPNVVGHALHAVGFVERGVAEGRALAGHQLGEIACRLLRSPRARWASGRGSSGTRIAGWSRVAGVSLRKTVDDEPYLPSRVPRKT